MPSITSFLPPGSGFIIEKIQEKVFGKIFDEFSAIFNNSRKQANAKLEELIEELKTKKTQLDSLTAASLLSTPSSNAPINASVPVNNSYRGKFERAAKNAAKAAQQKIITSVTSTINAQMNPIKEDLRKILDSMITLLENIKAGNKETALKSIEALQTVLNENGFEKVSEKLEPLKGQLSDLLDKLRNVNQTLKDATPEPEPAATHVTPFTQGGRKKRRTGHNKHKTRNTRKTRKTHKSRH